MKLNFMRIPHTIADSHHVPRNFLQTPSPIIESFDCSEPARSSQNLISSIIHLNFRENRFEKKILALSSEKSPKLNSSSQRRSVLMTLKIFAFHDVTQSVSLFLCEHYFNELNQQQMNFRQPPASLVLANIDI
jgi:hypothetical protein